MARMPLQAPRKPAGAFKQGESYPGSQEGVKSTSRPLWEEMTPEARKEDYRKYLERLRKET